MFSMPDHERAGTLQEELPTPVRVRVSILNRQAQGLRMFLAALQQEKLTGDEVEEARRRRHHEDGRAGNISKGRRSR